MQLFQHVMDGGDPIAVAGTVISPAPIGGVTSKPRNVLMLEVLADEWVGNRATAALARAMGVPAARPHAAERYAPLAEVDGASVHDVPKSGATGVLVQMYPAQHYYNLCTKHGVRSYSKNAPDLSDLRSDPFPKLDADVSFTEDYLGAQAVALGFLGDALAGKVPAVTWTTAPGTVADEVAVSGPLGGRSGSLGGRSAVARHRRKHDQRSSGDVRGPYRRCTCARRPGHASPTKTVAGAVETDPSAAASFP